MTSRAAVASVISVAFSGLAVLAVLGSASGQDALQGVDAADLPRRVAATPTASSASAAPSAPTSEPSGRISGRAVLSTTDFNPSTACAATDGSGTNGWCLQPGGDFAGVAGQPVDLAVSLCRLPDARPAGATFPSTAEARFSVHQEGDTLWSHARQHRGEPGRHTRRVDPGTCLTWTTTWWNRADDGSELPPGEYELELAVLAERVSPPDDEVSQRYRYTVRPG